MIYKLKTKVEFRVIICALHFIGASGHGRLVDPPARGTMWRLGFSTPPNYNDHELFCGGFARQWMENKGRCGECGDPYDLPRPRPNESGGSFGTGIISRAYRKEEEITITVHLTANHLGWFEFRLCENNIPKQFVKQSCLNKNVLQLVDHPGSRYELKHSGHGLFRIRVKLPEKVTCTHCIIQWHYTSGNNWGFCPTGADKVGCGPQEVFRGCSDVAIFENDNDDYFKFQNLTRIIDYSQTIKVNEKSGMYEIDNEEDRENENDLAWDDKKGDKENGKDKKQQEDKVYSKQSQNENKSSEKYDKSTSGEKKKFSNVRTYSQINRSKNRRESGEEKENYDKLFNNRDRDKEIDYRSPNEGNNDGPGNYVYSNTFRKSLSLEEQSKIRDYLKNLPSKELKSKELQHLINRPKASPQNRFENPEFLSKLEAFSSGTNTITKLSEVLSLLLSLTASTSSPAEANLILDQLAQSLTRAVEHKQFSDERKGKSFPRPRTTSFYEDRDSLEDVDDSDLETHRLYLPIRSNKRNAISILPRNSLVIGTPSTANRVSTPTSSRRSFSARGSRNRKRVSNWKNTDRKRPKFATNFDRSSEERIDRFSKASFEENVRNVLIAARGKTPRNGISLQVPSSSLPDVNPLVRFLSSNSSFGVAAAPPTTSSEEENGSQKLVYVLVENDHI